MIYKIKQQNMLVVKLKTFSMSADDFTENRTMTNHFPYCVFHYKFFHNFAWQAQHLMQI